MGLGAKITIAVFGKGLTCALALFPLAAISAPARQQSQDEIFLAARDAVRSGDNARLGRYVTQLNGHVLQPYAESWLVRQRLEDAAAEDVRAFLAREQGNLVADQVRREWLKTLGKKQRWELFQSEYPLLVNNDSEIACYALQARWQLKDESALVEVRAQWNQPRDLPEGCVPLIQALIADGQLTSRHVWERIRALLEAGATTTAWHTAEYLSSREALDRGQLFATAAGPKNYLDRKGPDYTRRNVRELTMFAVHRLARNDPQAAAAYWDKKLRAKFSAEENAYVWGQLALHAARRNLPEALKWYIEAGDAALSEEQFAWRMRAALRRENWKEVQVTANKMSPLQRNEPAWIYWRGRAAQALGDPVGARALFALVAGEHHFYARLAAEEMGLSFAVPAKGYTPTGGELAAVARQPGFQRALALYRVGLRFESAREWIWSIRGMDDKQLLAAAEFALQNDMFDRAINTADKTLAVHDFSVRYLAPHRDSLAGGARAQQLEEAWVLGLVRQESRFISGIKSSAGAAGLMQLMPATAKWVAKRMGMKDYSWSRVTEADVNAALGTYYLRHVLDDLDGNPVLAAAAYNAGPGRARRWRETRSLEGAIYAETIPFNETRDYVKKVMSNTMYYAAMLGGEPGSLKARLGIIAPRRGSDAEIERRQLEQEEPQ